MYVWGGWKRGKIVREFLEEREKCEKKEKGMELRKDDDDRRKKEGKRKGMWMREDM